MRKIFIIALSLLLSCTSSNNKTNYKNSDLLFRYINSKQSNNINDNDFYFLVMRTNCLCSGCYKITLDSALNIALFKADNKPIYILFDEKTFYLKEKKKHGNKIKYLLDETSELDGYGLTNSYPLLFHIKDNILIDFTKIIR